MKALYFLLLLSFTVNAQDVWVNGYNRSDGTYVEGYYRTAPNYTTADNYSTIGNQNPYTGKWGTNPCDNSLHYNNYAYNAPIQTNPLANTLPPPISHAEIKHDEEPVAVKLNNVVKDTTFELSQNVKDYQYEQTHQSPLSSLDDNRYKFNDFNKPVPVTYNTSSDAGMWIVIGFGALLFIPLLISIMRGNKG